MPNYYLSVLYKHIIQVKNKNVGLKVGGHKHTFAPPIKKVGGAHAPLAPPPRFLRQWIWTISEYHYIIKIGNKYFESDMLNTFLYWTCTWYGMLPSFPDDFPRMDW